jgi:BCD family chlorophyll transporter-like MFS transporter
MSTSDSPPPSVNAKLARAWRHVGTRFLPFADAATQELPLGRLLRLAMFQIAVGMAMVLLNGTLNRVMIVELGIPAWVVATMVSLPVLFAPLRAMIGFRSDHHRSSLGWRRVPYIWMGSLIQFGGLAIMPFALLVLSGDGVNAKPYVGEAGAALAFLLTGIGLHTTQTAGIALATDLAPEHARPRVVALLYVMLLVGMVVSSVTFGVLLRGFDQLKLIQVIQGSAVVTMVLNVVALWKQESLQPTVAQRDDDGPSFVDSWRALTRGGSASRLLVVVGLGTAGFSMQDILLEPYGGEILGLPVAATTALTALMAAGTLGGLALAARGLGRGADPLHLAGLGGLFGIAGLSMVVFSAPLASAVLFYGGTGLIGFGGGWFSVGTLTAAMGLAEGGASGLVVGAWGAVQATSAGLGVAFGGGLRDVISGLATHGLLGPGLTASSVGYSVVYHLEIALLFATLAAIGPLVRFGAERRARRLGLAEMPG